MSKANKQFNKLNSEQQQLFKIRHSAEHILTMAMRKFYPKMKMAMGPATDDGFYFDVDLGENKITDKEFKRIEKEMYRIINAKLDFQQVEISIDQARKLFIDNEYKQEWLDEIETKGEKATLYYTGKGTKDEFVDLCSGPHVDNTSEVKVIKLLKLAGAYWRGDEKNKMLTRIYGTAFSSKADLKQYLWMLKEAKKRDHRKLGKELDLFTFSDLVGPGLPMWTPKGTILRDQLDEFVWQLRKAKGYQKVTIPHLTKKSLYETSGHWGKYAEDLFKITTKDGEEMAVKPMNCPHHTQIFAHIPRSYRDMPQRYAETTMVYRAEQSGELSGLSRVMCITQDDAHVFLRKTQIKSEIEAIWDIVDDLYNAFDLPLRVRLSFRDDKDHSKYLGDDAVWNEAEKQMENIAKNRGADYFIGYNEAAFYAPKLDFMAKDSLGREHQVATIQLDLNMPVRFKLNCINEQGEKEQVYMIHAAIMGSIERFLSVLIEHLAGVFPLWLSPVQVVIIPISEKYDKYGEILRSKLEENGIRVEIPNSNESMQKRIRIAEKQKIPYMAIIGDKEVGKDNLLQTVSLRARGRKNLGNIAIDKFIARLMAEIKEKK